jgi:hypothetical protein
LVVVEAVAVMVMLKVLLVAAVLEDIELELIVLHRVHHTL